MSCVNKIHSYMYLGVGTVPNTYDFTGNDISGRKCEARLVCRTKWKKYVHNFVRGTKLKFRF